MVLVRSRRRRRSNWQLAFYSFNTISGAQAEYLLVLEARGTSRNSGRSQVTNKSRAARRYCFDRLRWRGVRERHRIRRYGRWLRKARSGFARLQTHKTDGELRSIVRCRERSGPDEMSKQIVMDGAKVTTAARTSRSKKRSRNSDDI